MATILALPLVGFLIEKFWWNEILVFVLLLLTLIFFLFTENTREEGMNQHGSKFKRGRSTKVEEKHLKETN